MVNVLIGRNVHQVYQVLARCVRCVDSLWCGFSDLEKRTNSLVNGSLLNKHLVLICGSGSPETLRAAGEPFNVCVTCVVLVMLPFYLRLLQLHRTTDKTYTVRLKQPVQSQVTGNLPGTSPLCSFDC